MRYLLKIIFSLIIILSVISSIYVYSLTQNKTTASGDYANQNDNVPPYFNKISGNITGKAGEKTKISILFSDNIGVTKAIIFYKPESAIHWSSKSIINGTFEIILPLSYNESWYYYVTIDDAKGNGPIGDPSIDGSSYYTITVINSTNSQDDNDENNNPNNSPLVFVEIGTKIVCSECPKVSNIMYDLYKSGILSFCYVSLPIDNPKASEYLKRYNIWGYPTVFIDGGYEITVGSSVDKNILQEKIKSATNRIKPKLKIHTQVQYITESDSIYVDIYVKNDESSIYKGELRVYLTEIISEKWQAGSSEHFSFQSFLIVEPLELDGNKNKTFTKTVDISDFDPENLMIFSVISNKESNSGFSQPPDKNKFEAHFVDAINTVAIIEYGNLPPEVSIKNPSVKYLHLFGKPLRKNIFGKTILLGRTIIVANTHDDSKITKVEFYINDKLMKIVTEEPYEWMWHSLSIGKKTISVKAYDDKAKVSTASIDVFVLMKWKGLFSFIFSK